MVKAKWLGQAGYLLYDKDTKIVIDPYLSNIVEEKEGFKRLVPPPLNPEELSVNLFIATHDHMDHLDYETVARMRRDNVKFAGPNSCWEHFLQLGIEKDNLISLNRGEKICLGDFEITGVLANHTKDSIGLDIKHRDLKIYFTADTLWSEDLASGLKPDILITCINGRLGNLSVNEALKLAKRLAPKIVIPNHYGMFSENTIDPKEFLTPAGNMGLKTFEHFLFEQFDLNELKLIKF